MSYQSRFNSIADIAGAEDLDHDAWGAAMGLFFDVASVLDMSDVEGDVTPEPFARWGYRRTPLTVPAIETVATREEDFNEGEWADDYTYAQVALASAVHHEELSQADLIYAGNVLDRYTRILKANGKDY